MLSAFTPLDIPPGPVVSDSATTVVIVIVVALLIIAGALWAILRKRPPRA